MLIDGKQLNAGKRTVLAEIMRIPEPIQSTTTGEWTYTDAFLLIRNYAEANLTGDYRARQKEYFGSNEYQPVEFINLTMRVPLELPEITTHDYAVVDGKKYEIISATYENKGSVIIKCSAS